MTLKMSQDPFIIIIISLFMFEKIVSTGKIIISLFIVNYLQTTKL